MYDVWLCMFANRVFDWWCMWAAGHNIFVQYIGVFMFVF